MNPARSSRDRSTGSAVEENMGLKRFLLGAIAISLAGAAQAASIPDPTGDFLPTYTGPHQADLDVTGLWVTFNSVTSSFQVQSTMAGMIDATLPGFYVIGVNTGTGTGPFGAIGAPNVVFNQVILLQKDGTAKLGATTLDPAVIAGNAFTLTVPLSLLPTTGFDPGHYGFSIWPRSSAVGGLPTISDFAPNNATLSPAPEPAAWAMMVSGFGMMGGAMRRRRNLRLRFV
jgi:hypothetical protein